MDLNVIDEMKSLLNVYPFDFSFEKDVDFRDVKSRMIFDKKIDGDKISMILLKGVGAPKIEKVPLAKVWKTIK